MAKKKIDLRDHYTEAVPSLFQKSAHSRQREKVLKANMRDYFINSNLSDILEADTSIYPRVLPGFYLKVIEKTARDIAESVLKLITLPAKEVEAIFPCGPLREYLVKELQVLKYRPNRLVGSLRFDMAIVGEPDFNNPPKLLEINEIGFDGLSRSAFIQETLFKIHPQLRKKYFALDSTYAELRNMRRLASSLARFQLDEYNWDEELLWRGAQDTNFDLRLISPKQLRYPVDLKKMYLMSKEEVLIRNKQLLIGDWLAKSYMVSYALETSDFKRAPQFYNQLVRNSVPQYSPFLTGLFASKAILPILADSIIQKIVLNKHSELEKCILPASMLSEAKGLAFEHPEKFVIKHVDGFGGEQVFMDQQLLKTMRSTPASKMQEWILQKRIKINAIEIHGYLSKTKKAISDLGVFCQYDWSQGKFNHFEVGGFLSRATNTSWKVNVSSGGAQVGVMFDKSKS